MARESRDVITRIQPEGWLLGVFGGCLPFVLGFIFADGVLLVVSLLSLVLLFLARCMGRVNLRKMELEVEMPHRVYAGREFELTLYLDNRKTYAGSFFLSVGLAVLHQVYLEAKTSWVAAGGSGKLSRRVKIPLRGSTTQMKLTLTSLFPLRLYHHEMLDVLPCACVVYPRLIIPHEIRNRGSLNDSDPQQGLQLGEAMGELRGIRGWQPGDATKRIHWPASARSLARGQDLRVREYDPPGHTPQNCCVIFHSHAVHGEVYRHDRFERACSLAAGTLNYLFNRRVKAQFTADFLAWQQMECGTRAEYIELLAILAEARRSLGTSVDALQEKLDVLTEQFDQVVLISDISPDAWSETLVLPENALVIDIRQIRFGRTHFAKAS